MKTITVSSWVILAALLLAGPAFAQESQHRATPLESARITIENRADADGYVRLKLTPEGGTEVEATVDVLRRMSENDIAADVEKALILIVGDNYRVERTGGENVRIRKSDRDTTPNFILEISFNTPGLTITIR